MPPSLPPLRLRCQDAKYSFSEAAVLFDHSKGPGMGVPPGLADSHNRAIARPRVNDLLLSSSS
jgi:hypothetical protein